MTLNYTTVRWCVDLLNNGKHRTLLDLRLLGNPSRATLSVIGTLLRATDKHRRLSWNLVFLRGDATNLLDMRGAPDPLSASKN